MLLKFFFNVSIEDTMFTCMSLEKLLRTYVILLGGEGVESMFYIVLGIILVGCILIVE
jgi:hypothetical protein